MTKDRLLELRIMASEHKKSKVTFKNKEIIFLNLILNQKRKSKYEETEDTELTTLTQDEFTKQVVI